MTAYVFTDLFFVSMPASIVSQMIAPLTIALQIIAYISFNFFQSPCINQQVWERASII